jgi:catechol 2,3-dioxygenase-like lactoylglutathione lyase family enzyme
MLNKRLLLKIAAAVAAIAASQPASAQSRTQSTNPIAAKRADHIAIRVPNFEETVRWYSEKLGFREVVRWQAPAYVGGGLKLAYLQLNDIMIEIAGDGTAPRRAAPAPKSIPELFTPAGWNHPCWRVDDMASTIALLKARGVEIYAGPNTNPTLKRTYIHIKDNNGFPIELVEYPRDQG